jgi:hypothetical protein
MTLSNKKQKIEFDYNIDGAVLERPELGKERANLFIFSKHFTRAFFILASNKLYVVFEPSRLEIFLFCQFWKFRIETDYTFFKSLV